MKPELWRVVLCWGAVLTFLSCPFILFALHIVSDEMPNFHFSQHLPEYTFLTPFYQSITALVFSLAGLNTLDRHLERTSNGKEQMKGTPNEHR